MIGWLMRLFQRDSANHRPDDSEKSDARDRADRAIATTMQLQAEIDAMTQRVRQEQRR